MTIKKPMKAPADSDIPEMPPATGGATIADRFKLDIPDANAKPPAGKATTAAAIAGLIGLAIAGILTYLLWQHWEYLMPA